MAKDTPSWMARLDAVRDLVGVVDDRELAKRAGVSRSVATAYRRRLGVPALRVPRPAPGVGSREAPIRETVGESTLLARLDQLATEAELPTEPDERPTRRTPAEVVAANAHRIGTVSDWMLARDLGVGVADIERHVAEHVPLDPLRPSTRRPRREVVRRLPADRRPPAEREAEPDPPAAVPAPEAEAVAKRPARRASKIAAVRDLVGTLTDAEVARRVGVTPGAVLQWRRRNGVRAAVPPGVRARGVDEAPAREARAGKRTASKKRGPAAKRDPKPSRRKPGPRSKLDAVRHLIGVRSDREVAELVGLGKSAVQMYRKKHGIPSSGQKPGRRASGTRDVPAPVGTAAYAWKLTIAAARGELVRWVVAASAEVACRLAEQVGEVIAIERVGEAVT